MTEAVIVLDGATDDSGELARSLELPFPVTVLDTERVGVGVARNLGLEGASEQVVLFLDDDTVPTPDCLAAHAAAHARGTQHVALGYCPPAVAEDWFSLMLRAWWEDHYRRKLEPNHRWSYCDFVTGNISLARNLLREVGGFDPAFSSRHEDWELGVRLLQRGVRFAYYPEAIAPHHLDPSLEQAVHQQRLEGSGDVLLGKRHPEVLRQLPFAGYEDGLPDPPEEGLRRGIARAHRLERVGLRTRWRRQVFELLRNSYVLGVRDELGSAEEFAALLARAAPNHEIAVPLDGQEPPGVPPLGQVEFVLQDSGRAIARVVPISPGRQWDWTEALERMSNSSFEPLSRALFRRELAAARGEVEGAVTVGFSRAL